ncbi:protein-S-isoprenylcysteine O-methyltransferase B-like [Cynara cardunculus var. scolymus]|nr:protein-S-isoprenylcysteine O-methyltransferase B-like [Cynara cardunculus var. scolymus]
MTELFSESGQRQLSQMFYAVLFFHVSEYLLAMACHGKSKVTIESLLITRDYVFAMIFAVLEYLVELYFFPTLKDNWTISNLGLTMVVLGETTRKLAILTAGRAFTHFVQRYHEDDHQLITYGVYGIVRHPGYTGFLIWSVGTQVMLCNPISTVAFAVIVWDFFHARIPYEEFFLKQFFGSQHEAYAQRVPSGIPFVK